MKGFEIIDSSNIMYAGKHYQKVLADDKSKPQCKRCVFNTDPDEADEVCLEIGNSNCDCANGEYWIENTMEIQIPEGCEVEMVTTGECKVVVKLKAKERKLPKSWEEFCEMYDVSDTEYFIDDVGGICNAIENKAFISRDIENDKNVLPDRATAEAVLALCQLIQLRNAYNGDWVPDWGMGAENKYCIDFVYDDICDCTHCVSPLLLHFKTAELRDEFLRNFRPLIEKLKPLYGIMEGGEEC